MVILMYNPYHFYYCYEIKVKFDQLSDKIVLKSLVFESHCEEEVPFTTENYVKGSSEMTGKSTHWLKKAYGSLRQKTKQKITNEVHISTLIL